MMKNILQFLLRGFISINMSTITGLVTLLGFNTSLGVAVITGLISGGSSYYLLKWRSDTKLIKQNELTRKEFRYIQNNLKEARQKIKRLNKAFYATRSLSGVRQIGKLRKMANKIFQIVCNEPKRFYKAERFFFYHLDSIVELSERYVFLSRQPVKDRDVRLSLSQTEETLKQLIKSLDDDLLTMLSNDIDDLNMELNVARHTLDRNKNTLPKERR